MSESESTATSVPRQSGYLTVLEIGHNDSRPMCRCRCICGVEKWVRTDHIIAGRRKSCGCRKPDGKVTHGHLRKGNRHPLYKTWASMIGRCHCETHKQFDQYGERGITVCERWLGENGFVNFLADMGPRPKGASIDRIDNDGGYEPSNCRWASRKTQQRNTRQNVVITHGGRTQCVAAWAEDLGVPGYTIYSRIRSGWTPERAITTPHRPKRRGN